MSRDLFIDNKLNAEYNSKGYLLIPNFVSTEELSSLINLYNKKEKSFFDKGFHRTLDLKDLKKKKEICDSISSVITPVSEHYLKEYRMLLTSFMTKEIQTTAFDIHQNWTFVEEDKYTSLVIWVPLQDVDETNGCMFFIPESDKWDKKIRGNNIEWFYEKRKDELMKQMIPLPMKAGDAVIFDDATIHYTSPNFSSKPRISIAQVMIPIEAQPIFYNRDLKTNEIVKYKIKDDFYLTFTNNFMKGDYSSIIF